MANIIATANRHSGVGRKANFPDNPGKKIVNIIYGHFLWIQTVADFHSSSKEDQTIWFELSYFSITLHAKT